MSEAYFSGSWYRVAGVRPRLRTHASIHRHVVRGAVWYVLQDRASGHFHRFTPVANFILARMDGKRTVQEIWDLCAAHLGDEMPPQDELIKLLSDLYRADVLVFDALPDSREQHQRRRRHRRQRLMQYLGNPLSLRFPLFDPDALLTRLYALLRPLWGWPGALLWLLLVLGGGAMAVGHWAELSNNVADQVFSSDNLLILSLSFPVVKFLHELAHGLSVKARGGEVREMGLMFLVFIPIPYVDASASSAFPDKRQRMLVGAAGMLADLAVGALAMLAWSQLEPGAWRAMTYNMMVISAASTLFFNGNPLLRYDGYYILSDWLEIPNLGQRANQYLGYLIQRYAFGMEGVRSPVAAAGERRWFVLYALASFAYRMFMLFMIVLLVASQFFFLGVLLALWSGYSMLFLPLGKNLNFLLAAPQLRPQRRRALLVVGLPVAILALLLFALPAPSSTYAEGVVWAPESGHVRAGADGEVQRLLANPMQRVAAGQPLVECADAPLQARAALLAAQLAELEARRAAARVANRVQTELLDQQVVSVQAELLAVRERLAALTVAAAADGTFIVDEAENLPGRYFERGQLIGFVVNETQPTVRVVVSQADAARVGSGVLRVEARPRSAPGRIVSAQIIRQVPAATDDLPSMSLSLQGGGRIGLDPSRPGNKSLETLFVVDLALPPAAKPGALGGRVHVRFVHAGEPLGLQWWRAGRRLVMGRFSV